MSKFNTYPWSEFNIKLNELESEIYFLFSDFVSNLFNEKPNAYLLDIAYKFMVQHLKSIPTDKLSEDAKRSRKIELIKLNKN